MTSDSGTLKTLPVFVQPLRKLPRRPPQWPESAFALGILHGRQVADGAIARASICDFTASEGASSMEAYDRLRKLVADVEEDVKKAEGGNKAAGTRVRKIMQEIRQAAQDLRVAILESRNEEPAPAPAAKPSSPAKPGAKG
jgi:Histone H1-like protein Hc1